MAETFKRSLIAHFLDTSKADSYEDATWTRLGVNVTSATIDYGSQTETNQYIVDDVASTEVTGFQTTMSVSQKCTVDDDVFDFINALRLNRATLYDAHTWMLNVDMWATSDKVTYVAEVQEVSISVETYGGDGGAIPTLEYSINFVGNPVAGTVTMSSGVPTFTASDSSSSTDDDSNDDDSNDDDSTTTHVVDGVIQDSWEELIQACADGLEQEYYSVGNQIALDLGDEGTMMMEIMGFQIDELADGSGYAPITFCADGLLTTPHVFNTNAYATDEEDESVYTEGTGSVGGWEKCELREYMYDTILPLMPEEVQNALAEVTREQQGHNTSGSRVMQECTDTIWVPGRWYDISKWYSDDPDTAAVVDDWGGLRYDNSGNPHIAWLRDGPALDYASTVSDSGYVRSTQVYTERYIILAFCLKGLNTGSTDSE